MSIVDDLRQVKVKATSADGSVVVRRDARGHTKVEFDARVTRTHTELSLAEAVTLALRGANRGVVQALKTVMGKDNRQPDADGTPTQRRDYRYGKEISAIDVRAESPRRVVKMRIHGEKGPEIRIRPDTFALLRDDGQSLASEVNTVINETEQRYRALRKGLHTKYYNAESLHQLGLT